MYDELPLQPSTVPPKFGLEVRHGPTLFTEPVERTTPAYTTFYETIDLWSKMKEVYFVLAQDANECGARISVSFIYHSLLIKINFSS